jgi:DNA-binding CsgD family transcriptional regulator
MTEAQLARVRLSEPPPPRRAVGLALYQEAELHRLRGEFAEAEQAYREASNWGRRPRPGLAQLKLAQGQVDAAHAAIRGLLDEARGRDARARVLSAYVDIALAANDLSGARTAADELSGIAADLAAPYLHAVATYGQGAVLLAEGEPRRALIALQQACAAWHELGVPYEEARTRLLIGLASRHLGDEDTGRLELDSARSMFQDLGAIPDAQRLDALSHTTQKGVGGLTTRELEVLRLVASGKTNKAIAAQLFISEKTVARHVSNMFMKLDLSSRAAATAYAYEHGLV